MYYNGCFFTKNPSQALSGKIPTPVLSKCVCVDHLNRCKTSIRCFGALLVWFDSSWIFFFQFSRRGWMHGLAVIHQRRHCLSRVIWRRDAFVTYLLYFQTWDVANPRTTKPFSNNLFTFMFARFSQSDLLLTSSDGTVASSKDVERILLHCFSRLVIHFLLSGLIEVFVHVRCFPHQ